MAETVCHFATVRELVDGCLQVVDVNWQAIDKGASGDPSASDRPFYKVRRNRAVMRSDTKLFTIAQHYDRIVCLAEARDGLCERIEHRLKIEC